MLRSMVMGLVIAVASTGAVWAAVVTRVADISPGPGSGGASFLTVYNDALYFRANHDPRTPDAELWRYDGTSTTRVADIWPGQYGSEVGGFTVYRDDLYFQANDGVAGGELNQLREGIFRLNVIPEPSTWAMLVAGAGAVLGWRWRRPSLDYSSTCRSVP